MKKIVNFPLRFKNPVFWAQVLLAVLVPILTYFGLTVQDMTSWAIVGETLLKAISNPYVIALVVISVFNAINDPTTPGIKDSTRARGYTMLGGGETTA